MNAAAKALIARTEVARFIDRYRGEPANLGRAIEAAGLHLTDDDVAVLREALEELGPGERIRRATEQLPPVEQNDRGSRVRLLGDGDYDG